jgi:hypothetical protein
VTMKNSSTPNAHTSEGRARYPFFALTYGLM